MNRREALDAAPPTPACFPDRSAWAEYLLMCQDTSKRDSDKPYASGVFRPDFDFCSDCTAEHKRDMRFAGRCTPSQFRGVKVEVES